jgi:RNase P protein component
MAMNRKKKLRKNSDAVISYSSGALANENAEAEEDLAQELRSYEKMAARGDAKRLFFVSFQLF